MLTLNVIKQPIDQSWSIDRIADEVPPRTWEEVFKDSKYELHDVSTILDEQEITHGQYYPLKKDIFAAFRYTPLLNVKVVILGQDPYHQTININGTTMPRAVGLSFSVRREDSIPSSLQNIYTELACTVRGFTKPDHGDLREWANQGVLLLNSCLTVRPGQPGSHGDIWLGFINKVFKAIAAVNPYCIFILWGREAQKVKPMLGERSVILEAAHPSGLSARRGFFGCNHFNLANDALIRQGKVGINWRISTMSELIAPPTQFNLSPLTFSTGHKPLLAPVDPTMLPTIIPMKPLVGTSVAVGVPAAIIQQHKPTKISPPTPLLPIIPNTKPSSPPVISTNPVSSPVVSNSLRTNVPIIPKIEFGGIINTPPPISLGNTQTPNNSYIPNNFVSPIINKPIIQHPTLTGLPIIPSLVH